MEVNRLWALGVEAAAPFSVVVRTRPPLSDFDHHLPAAEQPAQNPTHTVQRGETLSEISLKFLREQGVKVDRQTLYDAVQKLARANNLADADLILPGQELDLSVLAPSSVAAPQMAALAASTPPLVPVERGAKELLEPMTERPGSVRAQLPPRPERAEGAGLGGPHLAVNLAPNANDGANAVPAGPWEPILGEKGALTSHFGSRNDPFTGEPDFHKGIDIAAPKGTPIRAAQAGRVIFSGWQPGYGNVVIVRHNDGLETVYGHANKNLVKVGQEIAAGTHVAEVGSSGRSTGPHLHFEVRKNGRPVDPLPLLKQERLQVAEVF